MKYLALLSSLVFFIVAAGAANAFIVINEVETNPPGYDTANNEWVELYNNGANVIDLSGWKLYNKNGPLLTLTGSLSPDSYVLFSISGSKLVNDGDIISLKDFSSAEVDITPYLVDNATSLGDSKTWQRIPDGTDNWQFLEGTPGATNGDGSGGAIPEFPSFIVPLLIVFASIPLATRYSGLKF